MHLVIQQPGRDAQRFQIEPGLYIIGRDADCRIRLSHPDVALRHAILTVDAAGSWLEDLDSDSGTRVDGARIEIYDEAVGLGPLEDLLADPTVTEIMVNGPDQVYVERKPASCQLPPRRPSWTTLGARHHRAHRRAHRPAHRREPALRGRPPARRLARQRHHPAALAVGPASPSASSPKTPLTVPDLIGFGTMTDMATVPRVCVQAAQEHRRLRRHRLRQDHAAQRAQQLHPRRRAHRHHRGRRRTALPSRT
jgi:hypothetical protein